MDEQTNIRIKMKQMVHSVSNLKSQIDKEFENIKTEENDKKATILIGPTGSGKTTLYYALTNKTIKIFSDENGTRMITEEPDDKFVIDHNGMEEKRIGIKYDSFNEVIFCDVPGFFGNQCEIQDIINSFALLFISEHVKYANFLLVVSSADIVSLRGFQLKKICEIIENQFPNQENLQSSIGLVITDAKNGNTLLKNVNCENGWLLKYFKDNETKNKNIVFHLPAPELSDEQFKNNEEITKIRSFIQNCNMNTLKSRISLSNESELFLLSGINLVGDIRVLLRMFVDQIYNEIGQDNENLMKWLNRINELNECKFETPDDFIKKSREIIIPSTSNYEYIYDRMKKIQFWQKFLEPIFFIDSDHKNEIISQKGHLFEPVFADISLCFHYLSNPVEFFINTKILENKVNHIK